MKEFFLLFLIAIGLSMDAFSLSLGFGTLNMNSKQIIRTSISVGIFHFLMPLIGLSIGSYLIEILKLNSNFIMGIILLFISLEMLIELLQKKETKLTKSFMGLILFSFSVSLDAFSTGIGLEAITNNYILSSFIFSIVSFSFTFLGLLLGKYSIKYLGKYAQIIGIILLFAIAIVNLCQI